MSYGPLKYSACKPRRCRFRAVAALTIGLAFPIFAFAQQPDKDCQCRAPDGEMRDLGTVECVDIVGTRSLVRCEMSMNTPFWKAVEGIKGCPDA